MHYWPAIHNYWDSVTPNNCLIKPNLFGEYYLNFISKIPYPFKFDQNNIPMYKLSGEMTYHPTVICQYALGLYQKYFDSSFKNDEIKFKFLLQADWLVNNSIKLNNAAFWKLNYIIDNYQLKKQWCSGLVQGEAISVLLRAYSITHQIYYLNTAESALNSFYVDVNEGGFIRYNDKNLMVLEEYPTHKVNFTLNGHIFAMFGLYDFVLFNKNPKADKLFCEAVETLVNSIDNFDLGYWSKYSLFYDPGEFPCSIKYHLLHIEMLRALFILTGENIFHRILEKWGSYTNSLLCRNKALFKRIIY